jgi:uncharacterized protein YbjT (DUF2867 family)
MSQVIISGFSGLVGNEVLRLLIQEPMITSIILIGRTKPTLLHKKVTFYKSDFSTFPQLEIQINASAICCLGTTMETAGSKEAFLKIEHDMVLNFANWCLDLKCIDFHYVSALGANTNSKIFYNHVKGKVEEHLSQLKFKSTYFYRPSLLLGPRKEFRLGELIFQKLSPILNFALIKSLKKYQAIKASVVAKNIVKNIGCNKAAEDITNNKICIIENLEMIQTLK